MNEANLFAYWLGQDRRSKLTPNEIDCLSIQEIAKLDVADLTAVMYYGKGTACLTAIGMLRQKFEDELHYLESITYPQETTCE